MVDLQGMAYYELVAASADQHYPDGTTGRGAAWHKDNPEKRVSQITWTDALMSPDSAGATLQCLLEQFFLHNTMFLFEDGLIEALVGVATGTLSPAAKLALVDSEATENGKEIFLTFPASVIDEYAACLRPLNEGDEIGLRWIDFRAMGGKLYGRYIQEPGYDGAAERAAIEELGAEIRAMGKTTRDVRVTNTLIGNPYMVNAFVRGSDNAFVPGLSLVSTADADVEEGEEEEGAASGVAPGFNAPPADAGEQS